MSGIPKFGKNWLDNFIPDEEMQNTFMTSEVVRNVVMLQCVYYASVYNDLVLYKHSFINNRFTAEEQQSMQPGGEHNSAQSVKQGNVSMRDLPSGFEIPRFKVGIIGCGQVGTVILTKLLEVREQFHNLSLMVSTRQPHLLRPFQKDFGVECVFDNQKVAAECDKIFLCILPSQAQEVLKDIRDVVKDRVNEAKKDRSLINPVVVSVCAGVTVQKLKLMLSDKAVFLRTNIHVPTIKEYLLRTQAIA